MNRKMSWGELVIATLIVWTLVFIFMTSTAMAATAVTFVWDPNSESDLGGYRLYHSTSSGVYTLGSGNEAVSIPAGTETATMNVLDGDNFFILTAFDISGNESAPSNEVSLLGVDSVPPNPPQGYQITVTIVINP